MDLPDDIRAEVKKALDDATAFGNEISEKKAIEDRQKIIDSNRSEIVVLTDAERQLWVDAMKPVWKQFKDVIGKQYIEAAAASN